MKFSDSCFVKITDTKAFKVKCIERIIKSEGGSKYTNYKSDPGGETRFGITKRTALDYGYIGSMRTIPKYIAIKIYETQYWNVLKCNELSLLCRDLAFQTFDIGVNIGVLRSAKMLQYVIKNVVTDGIIGEKTLRGICNSSITCTQINDSIMNKRVYYYRNLVNKRESLKIYLRGWLSRARKSRHFH